jgi:hypothetical protein
MSREAKILKPGEMGLEKTVHHYESFGWELLSLNGDTIALSRDTQNPVYTTLVRNEIKYNKLVKEYNEMEAPMPPVEHAPFKFGKCLILLILGVIPGIIYIGCKSSHKRQDRMANAKYQRELDRFEESKKEALDTIAKLLKESRATFYARRK